MNMAPRMERTASTKFQAKMKGLMGSGSRFLIQCRSDKMTGRYSTIEASSGHLRSAASCAPRPGVQYPWLTGEGAMVVSERCSAVREAQIPERENGGTGGDRREQSKQKQQIHVLAARRSASFLQRRRLFPFSRSISKL